MSTEPDSDLELWRLHLPAVTVEELVNPHHQLLWQVRGHSDIVCQGTTFTVPAGHAMWVPAGIVHSHTVRADSVVLPVAFDAHALATTLLRPTVLQVTGELRTLLLASYQSRSSLIKPNVDLDRQMLSIIEDRPPFSSTLLSPVARPALWVAEMLRFNPGDDRSAEELATAAHVSHSTIKRAFLAETGMPLHRWRIANRMEAAAALLHPGASIPAVAMRVGYINASAFTRVFKEHFGVTPTEHSALNDSGESMSADTVSERRDREEKADGWRVHIPSVTTRNLRWDDQHMLLWQARGLSDLVTDGQRRALHAGQAVWIPAGVHHSHTVHANSVLLPTGFEADTTATTLRGVTVIQVDRSLRTLLLAQKQWQGSEAIPSMSVTRQILALIEDDPVLAATLPMPSSEAALAVAEALRFDPGDDRTIDQLASDAHVSRRTIERYFRTETGMTAQQWRAENRMEAAGILFRSQSNIRAVASRVGHRDVNAFRRAFKIHFGMTASEFIDRYNIAR